MISLNGHLMISSFCLVMSTAKLSIIFRIQISRIPGAPVIVSKLLKRTMTNRFRFTYTVIIGITDDR